MLYIKAFDDMVEKLTRGLRVISTDHGYSHSGISYALSIADINLANSASVFYSFKTGTDKHVHFKGAKTSDVVVTIFEGGTSTGGTTMIARNQNRAFPDASEVVIKSGVTQSIGSAYVIRTFQDSTPNSDQELILDQDTEYIIQMKNIAGAQNSAHLEMFWYEE